MTTFWSLIPSNSEWRKHPKRFRLAPIATIVKGLSTWYSPLFAKKKKPGAAFGTETGQFSLIVIAIGITSWMPMARVALRNALHRGMRFGAGYAMHWFHGRLADHATHPAQCGDTDHGRCHPGQRLTRSSATVLQLSGPRLSPRFFDMG